MSSEPLAPRAWLSLLSDHAHFTERLRLLSPDELVSPCDAVEPLDSVRLHRE
jgi:hypothetical protein